MEIMELFLYLMRTPLAPEAGLPEAQNTFKLDIRNSVEGSPFSLTVSTIEKGKNRGVRRAYRRRKPLQKLLRKGQLTKWSGMISMKDTPQENPPFYTSGTLICNKENISLKEDIVSYCVPV